MREILLSPPEELRRPELWWREQEPAIRAAIADRSYKLAYRLASASRQQQGAPFTESEWLAGWLALRFTGQPKAARGHFERLWPAVATPISKGRAGYWAGRAAAATGDSGGAGTGTPAPAYPSSFYGQLAAARAGPGSGDLLAPRAAASAGRTRGAAPARAGAVARTLCRLRRSRRWPSPSSAISGYETAADADALRAVVELARGVRPRQTWSSPPPGPRPATVPTSSARPFPPRALPALRADGDGLPEPALVLAVARQESLFDPDRAQPGRCDGPDAADAGDGPGDRARARAALLRGRG